MLSCAKKKFNFVDRCYFRKHIRSYVTAKSFDSEDSIKHDTHYDERRKFIAELCILNSTGTKSSIKLLKIN